MEHLPRTSPPPKKRFDLVGNQLQKILKTTDSSETLPLTARDEVIVKDTWNKFVAWQHIGMEAFVGRLYRESEEIAALLADFGDEVEDIFFGLFDWCVRQRQPHTERLGRESACPFHADPSVEWRHIDDYARWFADLGLHMNHWSLIRDVWQWSLAQSFILEEYEKTELHKGESSAFYRFFTNHIMPAMEAAITARSALLSDAHIDQMQRDWGTLCVAHDALKEKLVATLTTNDNPEQAQAQAHQWLLAITHWAQALSSLAQQRAALQELGRGLLHLDLTEAGHQACVRVALQHLKEQQSAAPLAVWRRWLVQATRILGAAARHEARLLDKANQWLDTIAKELAWTPDKRAQRAQEIAAEVRDTGTYTHTFAELEYGSRVAWRNTAKCIGRVNWNKMIVRDKRDVIEPDAMFQEVIHHLEQATAGDNVEIIITVFRAKEPHERWGPRFWNTQYIRYAAYEQPDGSVLGDRINLGYTRQVMAMGWTPPVPQSPYDRLPMVIHVPGQGPKLYELPPHAAKEVEIEHPDIPAFSQLGLRWCAIPVVSNIGLDLGGLRYTCTPFNGWFMGTEIARNLFEASRYDKAEAIARIMGLDTSSEQTLWRDRAFVELNVAILHSFRKARITLVDHHTASRQFLTHDRREKQAGRECPARWSWIVPPISGAVTEVFHHEMREFLLEPMYRELANRWEVETEGLSLTTQNATHDEESTHILILFGSESGTAENFAYQAGRRLRRLHPTIKALNDCTPEDLQGIDLLLVITSTFGDGDLPENAEIFARWLEAQPETCLAGLSYGVMGLGNSIYEHYCAAGVYFNQLLQKKGAYRLIPLHKGDELRGQTQRFHTWIDRISRVLQVDEQSPQATEAMAIHFLDTAPTNQQPLQTRWVRAAVLDNQELLDTDDPLRSTRHIAIDADTAGLSYEAGDHLSVYPTNDNAEVERLCQLLQVPPDAWFSVQHGQLPFALPATPRRVFAEELDISLLAPTRKLLEILHHNAKAPDERQTLAEWLQRRTSTEQPHPLATTYQQMSSLLAAFPSAMPSFAQLLTALPRLKPRLYSISSSPLLRPQEIHLTTGLVHVKTSPTTTQVGLCSHFLASRKPQDTIRVLVRPSEFCPPDDPSVPMLLIGPGTGIAPLIGFLEHRQAWLAEAQQHEQSNTLGPAWLYFGCRNQGEYLYQERLEQWQKDGVLTRLEVAFSRQGKQRFYVQDKMRRQHKTLWRLVSDPHCHVYICGDTMMAEDVSATLLHIAQHTGQYTLQEAQQWLLSMKAERRYFTDVWTSIAQVS